MHELGVIIEVIKTVESFALENELKEIQTLVLQIGEYSSIIPHYVEDCYPAAVDGTMLEKTELKIEVLPGNGKCLSCGRVFHPESRTRQCPHCESLQWELLGGKEFMIKEIIAC